LLGVVNAFGFEFADSMDVEPDLNEQCVKKLTTAGKKVPFQRNQHLYFQGDEAEHLFVLESGVIKATHGDSNGLEWLLRFHGPGSLMGIEALRPKMRRDASLVALEDVQTVRLSRDELFEQIRADGKLAVALAQVLAKRISMLHSRVESVLGQSVEQRVARALLQLRAEIAARVRPPRGTEPVLLVSHEELATLVLSRRQYVTGILRSFAADGVIENKRRRIRVLDPRRLHEILAG
jgi:CRP/FNR family transcriptional regulator